MRWGRVRIWQGFTDRRKDGTCLPKERLLNIPQQLFKGPIPELSTAQWWFCLFSWEHHLYLNTFLPHCNHYGRICICVSQQYGWQKKKTLYNEDTGWHATVASSYLQVKSYGQSMTVEGEERISFCQRQPLTCDPIQNGHLWTYEQCKVDFLW